MKILVTGSTGLIGSALVPAMVGQGDQVMRLTRGQSPPGIPAARWDPHSRVIEAASLEGVDAVVHLAGENIATGRWTPTKKARIRDSRVEGTRFLSQTLARLSRPPRVLVCASAVGFYGDRGEDRLTETSPPGTGFLAEVAQAWEAAARPAVDGGIRVVHLRFGMALSAAGGALAKMLLPFRLGVGGCLGDGRQYWSWITLEDVVGVIQHALATEALQGAVNAVAPQAVTNREFTKTLGRVLRRPTIFPVPASAARLLFGEMADELLLASTRAEPTRLMGTRYPYRFPDLEGALRHLLP